MQGRQDKPKLVPPAQKKQDRIALSDTHSRKKIGSLIYLFRKLAERKNPLFVIIAPHQGLRIGLFPCDSVYYVVSKIEIVWNGN